jgi:hypothetical protein
MGHRVLKQLQVILILVATAAVTVGASGGALENVKKIQVDATVIAHPESLKDAAAANLVRYDLRAALRDALIEEGDSPIRAHFVLDEFFSQRAAKRAMNLGTGRATRTVDGKLVIQDASGKELASVKIHVQGSVAFGPDQGNNTQGHKPASDFERRLLDEIERLK